MESDLCLRLPLQAGVKKTECRGKLEINRTGQKGSEAARERAEWAVCSRVLDTPTNAGGVETVSRQDSYFPDKCFLKGQCFLLTAVTQ